MYSEPNGSFTTKQDKIEFEKIKYGITPEDEANTKARKESARQKFTQGVYIDKVNSSYGDMFKIVLDIEKLKNNDAYTKGKIVFCIKKSKSGKYYADNMVY